MNPPSSLAAKDPEERRRRILAAAVEVLKEKGFAGARIADVAAAAGTSPALVVYHFKTLDAALAEAVGTVEDDFYDDLARLLPPRASALDRLRLIGELGSDTGPAVGNWALWMEVWVRAVRDAQTRALRRALDARWRQTLREVIDAGITRLWPQAGSDSKEALALCEEKGVPVIHGACVMMYVQPVQSVHRFHRGIWTVCGLLQD